MADPTTWLDRNDATCWQCGAPADAACSYALLLVADARGGLSALGYSVDRGKREDKVRVRVPRCRNCRGRNRRSAMITLGGMAVGALVAPIVQSRFWPQTETSAWLQVSHEGIGGTANGIGLVVGFVAAMLGIALHRRLSGLRSLGTYPPVIFLLHAGWHYPSD